MINKTFCNVSLYYLQFYFSMDYDMMDLRQIHRTVYRIMIKCSEDGIMKKPILTGQAVAKIILFDLLGSLLIGISVVTFAVNAKFAPSGVTGLSVILNYIFHLPIGWMTVLINLPIILFTFKKLGFRFFVMSVKSMLIGSLFIDYIVPLLPTYDGSRLLAGILSGICAGIGYALIYHEDSSTGGTDFIIVALKRSKPKLSFGVLTLFVDGSIVILSSLIYRDALALVFGIVYTVTTSVMIDLTSKVIRRYFPQWEAQST